MISIGMNDPGCLVKSPFDSPIVHGKTTKVDGLPIGARPQDCVESPEKHSKIVSGPTIRRVLGPCVDCFFQSTLDGMVQFPTRKLTKYSRGLKMDIVLPGYHGGCGSIHNLDVGGRIILPV
jgi:hypothetical protein